MTSVSGPFIVCFDDHHADGLVWGIEVGGVWYRASRISIDVAVHTIYFGPHAEQPRAVLSGTGTLRISSDGVASISPTHSHFTS